MRILVAALAAILGASVGISSAFAGPQVTPLVSTEWLEENLGDDHLVIIDYRSASAFDASHVPGALRTDYPGNWRTTLDDIPWALPEIADLEAFLSGLGVGPDSSVVVVPGGSDATELGGATWIYWVLKYLGHEAVAILDGGWAAWSAEGRSTDSGPAVTPEPAIFSADTRPEILATTAYVADRLDTDTVLVDARPPSQYTGETQSGLVTRAGHIPGAINLDNALLFDASAGRLKSVDALEALLPDALADQAAEIIAYCNTGHWSSILWFALHEMLGFEDVRLYEGSMAAWSRDPGLPVTLGAAP